MRRKLLSSLLIGVLMFSAGCGYTQKTNLPDNIKTIYIKTVVNKIPVNEIYAYSPGLEMAITKAVIRRMNVDGNLQVVSSPEAADVVLETQLLRFQQEGLRFSSLEQVEEFKVFIVVGLRLYDFKTDKTLWVEPNFSGDAEYFVSDVRSIGREEGVNRAVERLARNIVDRIVEDW